jgi:dihydroorotate dehydrogenase
MYPFVRPLLFKLDPETVHKLTLQLIRLGNFPPIGLILRMLYAAPRKPVEAFGLHFPNPVGLAAGYDKDGQAWKGLSTLGFGHVEVGTVTPLPQPGNPKPRVFRLEEDEAVINRMGFPGLGSEYVMNRLKEKVSARRIRPPRRRKTILGVNLGKNKNTPNETAVFDYLALLQNFAPLADYLAINVSSPNTAGLRSLQGRAALEELLTQLNLQRNMEQTRLEKRLPLLLKLAPDLDEAELDDALEACLQTHMDGIIVTNTTLARPGLRSAKQVETGGLSGRPLTALSESILGATLRKLDGKLPVVSAGGIMSPEDAKRRLEMGAALVQIYTGMIFAGPGLVKKIIRAI